MAAVVDDFHLELLKACQEAAPAPLFAGDYAARWGLELSSLEEMLEELRRRGLIHVTDWVAAKGTGYALSPQGIKALKSAPSAEAAEAAQPDEHDAPTRDKTPIRDGPPQPARPILSRLLL